MWKLVILAVAMALTGCGGGGGGAGANQTPSNSPILAATLVTSILTTVSIVPSLVPGKFDNQGGSYVIMSGWYVGSLSAPPVKIIKIDTNGTATDATVTVLGSEYSISVAHPVVADFNNDGIDDIFFLGFTDSPGTGLNPSSVFLSRTGQAHQKIELGSQVWSHSNIAVDLNNDGYLDVIDAMGQAYINNGGTGFTYQGIADAGILGSGICAGDFTNSGTKAVVVTDGWLTQQDTTIVNVNADFTTTLLATLPMPFFDRNNANWDGATANEYSHDVSCITGDVNNDGKIDIVMVSADNRPITGRGFVVQVYLNQGNLQFVEGTDSIGYQPLHSSYTPRFFDFNNDGKLDIWLMNRDWSGTSANQAWINSGSAMWTQSKANDIENLLSKFTADREADYRERGVMIPVKVGSAWNMVYTTQIYNKIFLGYSVTQWTF